MLLATVNPPAITTKQDSPFVLPTQVEGKYMKVSAERYNLKPEKVRFNVSFGYLIPNGIDKYDFKTIHRNSVELTSSELTDWGTDDEIIFEKIAPKFNLTIVKIEDLTLNNDDF